MTDAPGWTRLCRAAAAIVLSAACVVSSSEPGVTVVVPQDLEAEVNGVRLHYLDWGGEGQPLLLFVPGLSHTAHTFDAVAPAFGDRYHIVALTRRNHGSSDKPQTTPDLDVLVDDLAAFIGLFTQEPAIVAGQSYAGVEMPRLARRYPDRVRALIFLDAVYDWPGWLETGPALTGYPVPDSFASYEELDAWFRSTWPEAWNDAARAHLRSQTYRDHSDRLVWQFPVSGPGWNGFTEAYRGWTGAEYAGLSVPVLSIQAEQEGYFVSNLRLRGASDATIAEAVTWARQYDAVLKERGRALLRAAVPHAVHVEYADTSHWLHLQRPGQVIRTMDDFLREQVAR